MRPNLVTAVDPLVIASIVALVIPAPVLLSVGRWIWRVVRDNERSLSPAAHSEGQAFGRVHRETPPERD
jgi:hypothetical protein